MLSPSMRATDLAIRLSSQGESAVRYKTALRQPRFGEYFYEQKRKTNRLYLRGKQLES